MYDLAFLCMKFVKIRSWDEYRETRHEIFNYVYTPCENIMEEIREILRPVPSPEYLSLSLPKTTHRRRRRKTRRNKTRRHKR
jgi:hypothetical protein